MEWEGKGYNKYGGLEFELKDGNIKDDKGLTPRDYYDILSSA